MPKSAHFPDGDLYDEVIADKTSMRNFFERFPFTKGTGPVVPEIKPLQKIPEKEIVIQLKPMKEWQIDKNANPWIWEGFIREGNLTLLSAVWKSGKTTLLSHLLKAMDKGEKLAGKRVNQVKTFLLSEEIEALWAERRDDMEYSQKFQEMVLGSFRMAGFERSFDFWKKYCFELGNVCKDTDIKLVIVDTLSRHWPVNDENSATDVEKALDPLLQMMKYANCAVVIVHHVSKDSIKNKSNEGISSRGTGALTSAADITIEFSYVLTDDKAKKRTTRRRLATFSRYKESPPETIIEMSEDDEYLIVLNPEELKDKNLEEQIMYIMARDPELGLTASYIRDLLGGATAPSVATITRRLNKAEENGYLEHTGKTKNRVYYLK